MNPCRTLLPAAVAVLCATGVAFAHEGHDHKHDHAKPAAAAPKTDAAHDQAAAETMKYANPDAHHAALAAFVGRWKTTTKAWYAPGEPMVSEGESESRMIMGGRYLEQRMTGSMGGAPFEGYGLTGYDLKQGTYTYFWIDNMSTSFMSGTGTLDAGGRKLTTLGEADGPDGKPMKVRMVTEIVNDDTHVFTMYAPMNGQETRMLEMTYTRRK